MKEIYTSGKRGAVVCIEIDDFGAFGIASADAEKITPAQMTKALKNEYPNSQIAIREDRGYIFADLIH